MPSRTSVGPSALALNRARPLGSTHAYASAISYLAMAIWAYEELLHGVNWFRHLLGLGYAISTIVNLALALQS